MFQIEQKKPMSIDVLAIPNFKFQQPNSDLLLNREQIMDEILNDNSNEDQEFELLNQSLKGEDPKWKQQQTKKNLL